jgi:DNA-binding transcriptional MerR regulator
MAVLYPIRAAARLTGVSLDTLRAWERRYRAVNPERGARGRLYSDANVQRILLLKEAIERGCAIGQVASLSDSQLRELLERSDRIAEDRARKSLIAAEVPEILKPVLNAIGRYDYSEANLQMGRLAVLLPARNLVHQFALPLMRAVGDGWHEGRLSVAQEHMATAILRNILGSLAYMNSTNGHASRLLFATPSDENHEFGILAAAILTAGNGLGIVYLGPNLPAGEILLAAEECAPKAVVLGLAQSNPAKKTAREVRSVASRLNHGTELWVGGRSARAVIGNKGNARVVALEDFEALERHLVRIGRHL